MMKDIFLLPCPGYSPRMLHGTKLLLDLSWSCDVICVCGHVICMYGDVICVYGHVILPLVM